MAKLETKFQTKVLKLLKEIPDLWVVKVSQVSMRGTPDLLICYRGKFVAWELKTDSGVTSPLQEHTLNAITKAQGIARVVTPLSFASAVQELLDVGKDNTFLI